jgi:hypothetical protein
MNMTSQWDEFSKSLAEPLPRRESLRRLGAVVTGAVLGPLGLDTAFAGKQDPCKAFCKCRNKRQQDQCLNACKACNKDTSRVCGSCGSYVCCGSGRTCCGGYCTDLANDVLNCGACGFVCDEPGPYEFGTCIDGNCEYVCAGSTVRCNGTCTDVSWDASNCGDCGIACPAEAPYCVWGTCSFCPADFAPCGSGCCPPGDVCVDGVCQPGPGGECTPDHPYYPNCCPDGLTICNGVCTDLYHDPVNCGGCGQHCGPGFVCSLGACCDPLVHYCL